MSDLSRKIIPSLARMLNTNTVTRKLPFIGDSCASLIRELVIRRVWNKSERSLLFDEWNGAIQGFAPEVVEAGKIIW